MVLKSFLEKKINYGILRNRWSYATGPLHAVWGPPLFWGAQGIVPSPFSCSPLNGRCVFTKSTVLEKAVLMAYVDVLGF